MGCTYIKKMFVVYLKLKCNLVFCFTWPPHPSLLQGRESWDSDIPPSESEAHAVCTLLLCDVSIRNQKWNSAGKGEENVVRWGLKSFTRCKLRS